MTSPISTDFETASGKGLVIQLPIAELLAQPCRAGVRAVPNDVTGCFLEMGADGKWTGPSVGSFPSRADLDALPAEALAALSVGVSAEAGGVTYTWQGSLKGWGTQGERIVAPLATILASAPSNPSVAGRDIRAVATDYPTCDLRWDASALRADGVTLGAWIGNLGNFADLATVQAFPTTYLAQVGVKATAAGTVYHLGIGGWQIAGGKMLETLNAMLNATANGISDFSVVAGVATWAEGSGPSPWRVPDCPFMTRTGTAPESIITVNSWANCKRSAPYANGSSYMDPPSSVAQRVYTVAFRTDAPAVTVSLAGQHNNNHGVIVIVDGKIVFSGVTVAAGGSTAYTYKFFSLTFAVSGMHLVKIIMDGTYSCDGVFVSAPITPAAENLYTCRAAPDALPTLMISSDSFGAGTGADIPPKSCASLAALYCGLDPLVVANGGAGYVVDGPSSKWATHAPNDVLNHDADAYLFLLGVNDAAQPSATITEAVHEAMLMVRAVNADAPIFVCGPWNPRTAVSSAVRDAIFAGCAGINGCYTMDNFTANWQTGDGRAVYFTAALSGATSATMKTKWAGTTGAYSMRFSDGSVRSVTLTNGSTAVSWTGAVTATATAGAYVVAGNSTLYVGPDGTHPPQVGHNYLGARIGDLLLGTIRNALGLSGEST